MIIMKGELVMEVLMVIWQCVQMMDGVAKLCLLHNTRNKYIHSYMFVIEMSELLIQCSHKKNWL